MIRAVAFFTFSKLRLFILVAILLLGVGTFRAADHLVPNFSEKADEFATHTSQLIAQALSFGAAAAVDGSESGSIYDGLADRLAKLLSSGGENRNGDDSLLTGSTAEAADTKEGSGVPAGLTEAAAGPGEAGGSSGKEPTERTRSSTEQLILQKLGERRELLDRREEELNNREALLKASELRITQRIAELKVLEADLKAKIDSRNEQLVSLKPLVTMYEAMKPKDAAQVFENLEYATLVELVAAMNPRKVSDVVAVMEPKLASRVTKDLATRGRSSVTEPDNSAEILDKATELPDLPKAD
ncbi:MAG: MotE family protein [Hyphomicrobiales bacterium]